MNVGYIGYLPSVVRYNPAITSEGKLLYAELTAMCGVDARCKINYPHLRKVFTRNTSEIKALLNTLFTAGHIDKDGDYIVLTAVQPVAKGRTLDVDTKFLDEVLTLWNTLFKKELTHPLRRTADLTKALTERLTSFSKSEILSALKNRHDFVNRSEWHSSPDNFKHKVNIMLVLQSDSKIQENLNYEQSKSVDMRRNTVAVEKVKVDNSLLE